VPPEVVEGLEAGLRVPVVVRIGDYSYRSTVSRYRGAFLLPLNAEHRTGAGVAAGDVIEIELEVDTAPRVVEVPAELATALALDPVAGQFFAGLSFSHQRAYVEWITAAKRAETRQKRITEAVALLQNGQTRA